MNVFQRAQQGIEMYQYAKPVLEAIETAAKDLNLPMPVKAQAALAHLRSLFGSTVQAGIKFEHVWQDVSPAVAILFPQTKPMIDAINAILNPITGAMIAANTITGAQIAQASATYNAQFSGTPPSTLPPSAQV